MNEQKVLSPTYHQSPTCFTLIDIAPSFFDKQLNISIDVLINVFTLWQQAICCFIKQDLTAYDALVGENACHIRAAYITKLTTRINNDLIFKKHLHAFTSKLELLIFQLHQTAINKDDSTNSIKMFLDKHNLSFPLSSDYFSQIKYILDAHLLTLTKESISTTELTLNERTNYHRLKEFGLAKNKAKAMVSDAQKTLSKASCDYIQEEAIHLNNQALTYLLRIRQDAHRRSFLPQFIVAKVIFQRALQQRQNLLIKITRTLRGESFEQINLYFKTNSNQTDFIPCNTPSGTQSCFVASGIVNYETTPESKKDYISRLTSASIIDILYANFAMHPQYAGELKDLPLPFNETIEFIQQEIDILNTLQSEQQEIAELNLLIAQIRNEALDYEQKKLFAINEGCSLDNPSLLFFNHMFADSIQNHQLDEPSFVKKLLVIV